MNATATTKEIPPSLQMLQLISGFWIARCVYVAAKLGIPDLLKRWTKTADELATATNTLCAIFVSGFAGLGSCPRVNPKR
jgi:hypothetical protein